MITIARTTIIIALLCLPHSAMAREYQCGRHFAETSSFFQVIGGIVYNRTRDNQTEGNPKSDEYVVDAPMWAVKEGHTHISRVLYRKKGILYYRGKPCIEYPQKEESK
jgi:hypothetical protein